MNSPSHPRGVLGAIASFLGLGGDGDGGGSGLRDRDVGLAKKLIAEGAVVLDVRTPGEFASGHVKEAKLIPVQELAGRMAEVDKLTRGDKDKPIVVYCAAGARAGKAKQMLVRAGYKNVMNAGGYGSLAR